MPRLMDIAAERRTRRVAQGLGGAPAEWRDALAGAAAADGAGEPAASENSRQLAGDGTRCAGMAPVTPAASLFGWNHNIT